MGFERRVFYNSYTVEEKGDGAKGVKYVVKNKIIK